MRINNSSLKIGASVSFLLMYAQVSGADHHPPPDEEPDGPINMIIMSSAGGKTDLFGRALKSALENAGIPNTIQIENSPGGGGTIAINRLLEEDAPNNTLLIANDSFYRTQTTDQNGGLDRFAPIAMLAENKLAIWVNHEQMSSYSEFANADERTLSGVGFVSGGEVASDILNEQGLTVTYLPMQSTSESIQSLMSGAVSASALPLDGNILDMYNAGEIVPILQMGDTRAAALPDTPTMSEVVGASATTGHIFVAGSNEMSPGVYGYYIEKVLDAMSGQDWQALQSQTGASAQALYGEELRRKWEETSAAYGGIAQQ